MKTKIEIEIDIPDGWEFVRYGKPKQGEFFLHPNGKIIPVVFDRLTDSHVILREAWQQPDFLKPGWIAMNNNKHWTWHRDEPTLKHDFWVSANDLIDGIYLDALNWTPPPCDDWRNSKRRIV